MQRLRWDFKKPAQSSVFEVSIPGVARHAQAQDAVHKIQIDPEKNSLLFSLARKGSFSSLTIRLQPAKTNDKF